MNAECRLKSTTKNVGRSWAERLIRISARAALMAAVAGCIATEPPPPEPVAKQVPVVEKQTIERLAEGRTGFVITEMPDPAAPWIGAFEKAVTLLQESRDAEAVPILEEVVSQSPGVTAPHINLAIAYRHTEQFKPAEEQLLAALALVPDHPVAKNEYGLVLRHTGRFGEARAVYEAALEGFPEYLPARLNLGILCELYLKDLACAIEQYTTYHEANPGHEAVAIWIADLNLRVDKN